MKAEQRITRARIQLQRQNSFWAYLSLYLKFHEIEKGRMRCDTMGVDIEGNVHYVEEFIDKLNDNELQGVIAHELGHLIYLTQLRQGGRDEDGWNIASDIAINSLLGRNNFTLPKDVLMPNNEDKIETGFNTIEKISEKTAEQIYDELPKITIKNGYYYVTSGKNGKKGNGSGEGKKLGRVIDEQIKGGEGNGKDKDGKKTEGIGRKLTPNEVREIEKEWKNRVVEAHTISKMRGDVPEGIDRLLGKLYESKIEWRSLLQKYITNQIPYDYTFSRPSKKSVSIGEYLPEVVKEKIDLCVCCDLSGSIGQDEYSEFISEVIGLARAFQEKITMRFYSHDTSAYFGGVVDNGNLEKIKDLKLKGGGGTSHKELFDLISEKERDCKCAIFLTDGYSDLESIKFEEYPFDKIFVISKNGDDSQLKGKPCEIIHLKE